MKLKIETWPIDKVLPFAKNARLHSEAQVAAVSKSIAEFGFVNPCLVDANGVLIAGHCRILSAKQIGMETVPVIRLGHLTEIQARALRLADNQLPQLGSWSAELIAAEISDLKLLGYDVPLLGFPESQLRGWGISMGTESSVDPEATPELPKKTVVRKGDLWILGDEHRLLCGNARNETDCGLGVCFTKSTKIVMLVPCVEPDQENAAAVVRVAPRISSLSSASSRPLPNLRLPLAVRHGNRPYTS